MSAERTRTSSGSGGTMAPEGAKRAGRAEWTGRDRSNDQGSAERDFEVVPFSRFQHQAVDWLGIMHRRHTAHLLLEVDVTRAREATRAHREGVGGQGQGQEQEQQALTAFVAACLAQAVAEDRRMQAYRSGRNHLVLFSEVDVALLLDLDQGAGEHKALPPRTPHIVREANRKSMADIEREIAAERVERTPITVWLSFWLLLPGVARRLIWLALLNNPRVRKNITGTISVAVPGMGTGTAGIESAVRWAIPLTAYTLSLALGGIARKPAIVPPDVGAHEDAREQDASQRVEVRDYLGITLSVDDDVVNGGQAARFAERLKELIEAGPGPSLDSSDSSVPTAEPQQAYQQALQAPEPGPDRTAAAITAIKAIHTAIFAGIAACVGQIAYSGFTGRVSRLTKLAVATVAGEVVIFSRNGMRCPLADMAEDLGSEHGTVGDIFLPKWFAERIPLFSSTLLGASGVTYLIRRLRDRSHKRPS